MFETNIQMWPVGSTKMIFQKYLKLYSIFDIVFWAVLTPAMRRIQFQSCLQRSYIGILSFTGRWCLFGILTAERLRRRKKVSLFLTRTFWSTWPYLNKGQIMLILSIYIIFKFSNIQIIFLIFQNFLASILQVEIMLILEKDNVSSWVAHWWPLSCSIVVVVCEWVRKDPQQISDTLSQSLIIYYL